MVPLVGEFRSVDALAARPVPPREVAALAHEVRDDPVERRALEVEGAAARASALLARAERAEILGGPRADLGGARLLA